MTTRPNKSKQVTVRIGPVTEQAIQEIGTNADASQSVVVRAMLAYASRYPQEVELMIREYRLVEL